MEKMRRGNIMQEKPNEDKNNSTDGLPDRIRIYDAISVLIDIASYIAKIDDDTSLGGCRNGDLRDWPQKDDIDYTDEFRRDHE